MKLRAKAYQQIHYFTLVIRFLLLIMSREMWCVRFNFIADKLTIAMRTRNPDVAFNNKSIAFKKRFKH